MADNTDLSAPESLNDEAQTYILDIVNSFRDSQAWMYNIFRQDEVDHAAITCAAGNEDAFNDALQNPYQFLNNAVNSPELRDTWKSTFNSAVFARAKAIALTSHIGQAYEQNHRSPISIVPTELSDAEQNPELSEEQRKQIILEVERQTQRGTQKVMDMLQEGGVFEELKKAHWHFPLFGIACGEFNLYREVKTLKYEAAQPSPFPGAPPIPGRLVPHTKQVYTVEVTSPYDIILDPSADGDPQAGVATIRVRKYTPYEAQAWIDRMERLQKRNPDIFGEFNAKAAKQVVKLAVEDAEESPAQISTADVMEDSLAEQTTATDTRTIRCYAVYMKVFGRDLDRWEFTKLKAALKADAFYSGMVHAEYTSYEIEAFIMNGTLVYAGPNPTPDKKRPIFWCRRIPVFGTNYGFSIYSITRPLTRELTRMVRNALDNMSLASNLMVAVDESVVDMSTFEFSPGAMLKLKRNNSGVPVSVKDAIQQLHLTSTNSDIYRLYDMLMFAMDEVSNVPKNMTGVKQGTSTAFEIGENMSAAQTVTLEQVKQMDTQVYAVIGYNCYLNILEDPMVPMLYKAEASVQVTGAQTFLRMVLEKQKKIELVNLLTRIPPDGQAKIDWENMLLSIIKDLNMDNPETLVNATSTIIQKLQEQIQQLQQQFQQTQQMLEKTTEQNKKLEMENNILSRMTDLKAENLKLQMKQDIDKTKREFTEERQRMVQAIKGKQAAIKGQEKQPEQNPIENQE